MAERADQPVLVRLGTRDDDELRDGFPKSAEELYQYHAIVLDDLEAGFFTPDQLALLRNFVSQRGGGLLMLGGARVVRRGEVRPHPRRRPAAGLPRPADARRTARAEYRLVLTREGWLQPWVRLRKTEDEETEAAGRDAPASRPSTSRGGIKPGAVVLAEVRDAGGQHRAGPGGPAVRQGPRRRPC